MTVGIVAVPLTQASPFQGATERLVYRYAEVSDQPREIHMRILPVLTAAVAVLGLGACTVVERERPAAAAPAPVIVQPAPQVMAPPPPPPTVTVRPSY